VVLPSSVSVSTELSGSRTFDWRLSDIPVRLLGSMDTPTTARQHRHRMSTSSGRPVDLRVPRRWTPCFLLGSGRARARPLPVPMNLPRPSSFPLPRQRLYFFRQSSGGTISCYFERRITSVLSSVT